jgi:hypothetical protein
VSPLVENQQVANKVVRLPLPIEITIPNLNRLFRDGRVKYAENQLFVSKCHTFLVELYLKTVNNKKVENGFVPLMSEKLKRKYGNKNYRAPNYYKTVIDTLVQVGLVMVDDTFVISTPNSNGSSKSYKLLLKHPERTVLVSSSESEVILKRSNTSFHDQLRRLELNEWEFFALLNLQQPSDIVRGMHFYNCWINGEFYSFDDKNGRIHTPLHSLSSVLRSSILFKGQPLRDVDVSACQPFLLLKVTENRLNYKKKIKRSLLGWAEIIEDLKLYIELIQSGDLYRYLFIKNKGLKKLTYQPSQDELSKFKEKFFARVMFANELDEDDKIVKVFKANFPTVFNSILFYQQHSHGEHLANYTQKLESEVINGVLERLNLDDSNIALRFHDAILVNQEIEGLVKIELEIKLREVIGVDGKVKISDWGKPIESVMKMNKFNPVLVSFNRERAIRKEKAKIIKKGIGRKKLVGSSAQQYAKVISAAFDNNEFYKERFDKMRKVKLILPGDYSSNEVVVFKEYMASIIERHNESLILEESPLQFLAKSKTNLLTLQLHNDPNSPEAQ